MTACTSDRARVFGRVVADLVELSPIGRLVDKAVRSISSHHPGWELDMHVVMPDHVHVILLVGDRAGQVRPLRDVVGAFKAQASRRAGRKLWQRGYHDRIIRNESELNALREYIATNPLRWTLRRDAQV